MAVKTLYLHVGWSKTGTSAIQKQLNIQFENLKSKGILYSKEMQMNDHAHHNFALAFGGIVGYKSKFSIDDAIQVLDEEMKSHFCHSLLISSELSPIYFNNQKFCAWVERFDEVKIIFTLRRQSELLLSLFNQLVKDPQIRYRGSFFQLAISNFPKVNFHTRIAKWAEKVGAENIKVLEYDKDIVGRFVGNFNLNLQGSDEDEIVNSSLPNELLQVIQDKSEGITDPNVYAKLRNDVVLEFDKVVYQPEKILVRKGELSVIDNHFEHSNNLVAKKYLNRDKLFARKNYLNVMSY